MGSKENIARTSRDNILDILDNFIENIQHVRKFLLIVSISVLFLAPLSIGLSVYLITHRSFFKVLENNNDFGSFLILFLVSVIIISIIWMIIGIKHYFSLSIWNKKYKQYIKRKTELDETIYRDFDRSNFDNEKNV